MLVLYLFTLTSARNPHQLSGANGAQLRSARRRLARGDVRLRLGWRVPAHPLLPRRWLRTLVWWVWAPYYRHEICYAPTCLGSFWLPLLTLHSFPLTSACFNHLDSFSTTWLIFDRTHTNLMLILIPPTYARQRSFRQEHSHQPFHAATNDLAQRAASLVCHLATRGYTVLHGYG